MGVGGFCCEGLPATCRIRVVCREDAGTATENRVVVSSR